MSKLIMILSGEDIIQRHRSKKGLDLYYRYNGKVPILISGSHSGYLGRETPSWMKKECWQARDFLISQGISNEKISCEEHSLDTLGNFYFSQPLIRDNEDEIDLVTDKFHMDRSLWCARLVFGNSKKFVPILTEQTQNTPYQKTIENLQIALLRIDMTRYDVKSGDYTTLTKFMNDVHPFYCNGQAKPSTFGSMIKAFGNKKALKFLPTQKQAYKKDI